jgi:hypothetical protein
MFWTGNPSDLLLEATPQPQQEGSKKCPVSMGTNSNPEKDYKTEESPVIQSTVAKDTPTTEPDQESLDAVSENQKACGTSYVGRHIVIGMMRNMQSCQKISYVK